MNGGRNQLREGLLGWRLIFLATAWVTALSSLGIAEAGVIKVPSDRPTIQQAIDAALAGDTVQVAPGTYVENINFHGKAITVQSEHGPQLTIIDGNAANPVATFTSGEGRTSVLSGFTLRNGLAGFTPPAFGNGGGISISESSPTITNNVIAKNRACAGVGISSSFGSPLIQGNSITGNVQFGCSGGSGGGGIGILFNSAAEILDNDISDNVLSSANGGGISLFAAGTPTIRGNVISGNTATGLTPCTQGGGIWIVNFADALIVQNLIVGNEAGCGGGIFWSVLSGQRGPLLVNNTIADNDGAQGSGIYASGFDAKTLLINNIIIGKAGQTAIFCTPFEQPSFKFNNVFSAGGTAYGGLCTDQTGLNGNISAAPLFVDPLDEDYHLQDGSPSVDAGDNTASSLPATDLDGNARICDGDESGEIVVDMGAYELCASVIQSLGPANVWLGLKNSDDVGLRVDVLAEVFLRVGTTETKIGQGQLDNKPSGSSGFVNAIRNSMTLSLIGSAASADGWLEFRLSVRRTCSGIGHRSGTVRLWYNGQPVDSGARRDAGSRLAVTIGSETTNNFLRESLTLGHTAGSSRLFIDRFVDSRATCPGRPFTPFGTWSVELP